MGCCEYRDNSRFQKPLTSLKRRSRKRNSHLEMCYQGSFKKEWDLEEDCNSDFILDKIPELVEEELYLRCVLNYVEKLLIRSDWSSYVSDDLMDLKMLEENDSYYCHIKLTFSALISTELILQTLNVPSRRVGWDNAIEEMTIIEGSQILDAEIDVIPYSESTFITYKRYVRKYKNAIASMSIEEVGNDLSSNQIIKQSPNVFLYLIEHQRRSTQIQFVIRKRMLQIQDNPEIAWRKIKKWARGYYQEILDSLK
ncbi:unnamed protein product [Blepharisma stoltei]|uniref:START domain-containing protein n=1 Tax=Blepharisma stoltei TaxID=1481888 RepID=A0AAU9IXJ7_9CILI|nr:unnamed protein product [Blepharisma stoltei]